MYVLIFVIAILLKLAEIIYTTYFNIYKKREYISYSRIFIYSILAILLMGTHSWFYIPTIAFFVIDIILFPNKTIYLMSSLCYILNFTYDLYIDQTHEDIGPGNVIIQIGNYNEDLIKQTLGQPIFVVYDKNDILYSAQYKNKSYSKRIVLIDPPEYNWESYYTQKFEQLKSLLDDGNTIYFPGTEKTKESPPLAIGEPKHQTLIHTLFAELTDGKWTIEDEIDTHYKVSNARMLVSSEE